MINRIEVYEKYIKSNGYSAEWWKENMPSGTTPPQNEYGYRRTMILVDQIERPIEIVGNSKECILRLWGDAEMTIKCNYDDFCILFHDIEEQIVIEQEFRFSCIQREIGGEEDAS